MNIWQHSTGLSRKISNLEDGWNYLGAICFGRNALPGLWKAFFWNLMLSSLRSWSDLGVLCEFKDLIDKQFWRDGAPRSVVLWGLGSNMFRIIGLTDRCRADFAKYITPRFFCPPRWPAVYASPWEPPATFVIGPNQKYPLSFKSLQGLQKGNPISELLTSLQNLRVRHEAPNHWLPIMSDSCSHTRSTPDRLWLCGVIW